jgi:predicted nucleic acid-binding protein
VSFLLDTNVVSEWVKRDPDPGVVVWLSAVDEDRVFVSVITLAELRYGVDRMDNGARRRRIEQWLRHEMPLRFEGRILSIDAAVADSWGKLVALREAAGRRIEPMDAFIAATAQVHDLTLVTRNAADFQGSVRAVVDPWSQASR